MLACAHTWPSRRPGAAAVITSLTAAPSDSIVTMMSDSLTASAGVAAMTAPSDRSACALAGVLFQARSGSPDRSMLRPIPRPMIPVPSSATDGSAGG